MQARYTNSGYILRLMPGEKVAESLAAFCAANAIHAASVQAIGAVSEATLGLYNLATKGYIWREFKQEMELAGLIGNIALRDGAPFLHAHATISDSECRAFGGHVQEMTVSATVEVVLTTLGSTLERELDEYTGLKLLVLDEVRP